MANLKKFEEMLERLINEDREGAEELFHEIVVEKSRDIYESLLEDEEEVDESDDEEVDESDDDDLDEADDEEVDESDEELDENFDLDEFEVEADPMGGDPADDMMGDLGGDDDGDMDMDMDMGDDDGDEGLEDRVMDLEDALDDLKAEFEAMMGDDDGDDDMDMDGDEEGDDDDMDMDGDEEEDDEENESFYYEADDEDDDEEVEEAYKKKSKKTPGEEMREYVEKIQGGDLGSKIGGDNGANSKSIVAKPNNMGGTTQNILRTDTENGTEANKGALKGSSLSNTSPKTMNTKNINVPGGKAGKTAFKKSEPGHGAERKGKPETADKGAGSTLNKVSSRAK